MFVHIKVETCEQSRSAAESLSAPLALEGTGEHLLLQPPPSTHTQPTHFQGINNWARVCSSGPLMADHAGARGNTIHADEQPARSETEGVVSVKGSQESGRRWI